MATADDFLTTFEARCRKSGIWPEKSGETERDAKFRDETQEAYLSLNEGELIAEIGPKAWQVALRESQGHRPTQADRQEMEAWRATNAFEVALTALGVGKVLMDNDGEIIAYRRACGRFGIWVGDDVTSTNVSTAREAAELLGGVR